MKVYNQEKTYVLTNYDLEKGYLKEDELLIKVPEIREVKEEGYYKTIAKYPNGGEEVEWVVTKKGIPYQPAHEETENILVYIPYTQEELIERNNQERIYEIKERLNVLSEDFTQAYLGAQIEDIEDRKVEFQTLHNELRNLLGKTPREYK